MSPPQSEKIAVGAAATGRSPGLLIRFELGVPAVTGPSDTPQKQDFSRKIEPEYRFQGHRYRACRRYLNSLFPVLYQCDT